MLISWNEAEDHQDPKRQNEHSIYSVLDSLLLLCISSRTCHHKFTSLALYCFLQVRYIVRVTIFMTDLPTYTGSLILFPSDSSSCTCRFGEGAVETSYLVE